MKTTLEYIIEKILPNTSDKIKISEESTNGYVIFTIETEDEIKPLLIGRNGKTIKAIYNLLYPIAKRERIYNFQIKIKD
ncbi:KH domain-containing protein [Candidatus Dojkabacteria bacterium]|nr:KH domain-containing protein [Candidatus Dojkabacteria bacterium]